MHTKPKNLTGSYQVCATVKRLCLWILLLRSIRLRSRGEFLGDSLGEMDEGERRCPRGRSCCRRFSLRIFTKSSFSPTCLGMGGTASVSWWPTAACWAILTLVLSFSYSRGNKKTSTNPAINSPGTGRGKVCERTRCVTAEPPEAGWCKNECAL